MSKVRSVIDGESEGVVLEGDCLERMKEIPDDSVDSVVTDPPSGNSFMNKNWDSDKGGRDKWIDWMTEVMSECKRVLKPGGMALVWGIPKRSHWTAMAIERAGFEILDKIYHLFAQGFPKSHAIGKAIDKKMGKESDVVGEKRSGGATALNGNYSDGKKSKDVWRKMGVMMKVLLPSRLRQPKKQKNGKDGNTY